MAIKPVSLTYGGDAATALKWVGFAKKKARMLADWCMSNGQPTGNNHIWPVPDVKIRVWYINGMLKAHIEAEGGLIGVAFWGITTSFPHGWGIPYTDLNSPLGTAAGDYAQSIVTKKERLLRAPNYTGKLGITGGDFLIDNAGWIYDRLQYGSKVCQIKSGQPAYTIHRHELGTRYYGAELSSVSDRWDFARGGVGESTAPYYCHGAFSYGGSSYAIVHVGTFTTGGEFTRTFSAGSVLKVLRVSTGSPTTWVSAGQVAVNGLSVVTDYPGTFATSKSGETSVAVFCTTSATVIKPVVLKMATNVDSGVVTATFHVQAEVNAVFISNNTVSSLVPELDTTDPFVYCPVYDTAYVATTTVTPNNSVSQNQRLLAWDVVEIRGVDTVVYAWLYVTSAHSVTTITDVTANSAHTLRFYNYWGRIPEALTAAGCTSTPFDYPMSETATQTVTSTNGVDLVITGTSSSTGGIGTEISRKSGLGLSADGLLYGAGMSGSATTTYEWDSDGVTFTITDAPSGAVNFTTALVSAVDLSEGVFFLTTYTGYNPYGLAAATPAYIATVSVVEYSFSSGSWTTSNSMSAFTGTYTKSAQAATGIDSGRQPRPITPVQNNPPTANVGGQIPVMTAHRDGIIVAYNLLPAPAPQPTTTTAEPAVYKYSNGTLSLVGAVDDLLGTPAVTSEAVTLKAIGVI